MSTTLALIGDVMQHGRVILAAGDDLSPSNAADANLNLALWSTIAGTLTPFLVAFINQPKWSSYVRALMTVLVSVGIGAVTAAWEGRLDGTRWTTATLVVLAAAVGTYHTLWRSAAPAFEQATSPGDPAPAVAEGGN